MVMWNHSNKNEFILFTYDLLIIKLLCAHSGIYKGWEVKLFSSCYGRKLCMEIVDQQKIVE